MKTLVSFAAAAAFSLIACASVQAHPEAVTVGNIKIELPWTRATPGKAMTGGGFLKITNTGDKPDRLMSVSSPRAGMSDIHSMMMKDGVMQMRPVEGGLEIPAGKTVELKPGGYHVMFMKLKSPFRMGEIVPLTLKFEHAGTASVDLSVEKPGATDPAIAKSLDHDHDHDKTAPGN